MSKIWIIVQYNEVGPLGVWAFETEEKAREFGVILIKGIAQEKRFRIGEVEVI